jgi:DNA invertase Pin-like site-specific DNA recombinase
MNVGYLSGTQHGSELQKEMAALERVGCERIVVGHGRQGGGHPSFGALLTDLADGQTLYVWSLDDVADSLGELVGLMSELERRNVRFRALADNFDTGGKHRTAFKTLFKQLQEFQARTIVRLESEAGARRTGRPRALSSEEVKHACELVKQGQTFDAVAKRFQVSRATLYRYFEEIKKGLYGTYGVTWSALPEAEFVLLHL